MKQANEKKMFLRNHIKFDYDLIIQSNFKD